MVLPSESTQDYSKSLTYSDDRSLTHLPFCLGIVILENAIEVSHLDALAALLGPEAEEVARDPDHHFNFGYDMDC